MPTIFHFAGFNVDLGGIEWIGAKWMEMEWNEVEWILKCANCLLQSVFSLLIPSFLCQICQGDFLAKAKDRI